MQITDSMKLKEVEREIRMRKLVYQRSVDRGSMSALEAAHSIAIMESIRDDYRRQIKPDLFPTDSPPRSGSDAA